MRGPDAPERHPPGPESIREQLGEPYRRYDAAAQRAHAELVAAVSRPHDLALAAEQRSDREWTLTVCVADHLGGLSVIAGLMTAHRIDIVSADVFTLTLDAPSEGAAAAGRRQRPDGGAPSRRSAWRGSRWTSSRCGRSTRPRPTGKRSSASCRPRSR